MRKALVATSVALAACGPFNNQPTQPATEHRLAAICDAAAPHETATLAGNSDLDAMQQANIALSECMWRNAVAFSRERESAEIVGKAVADACFNEWTRAEVADQRALYPNRSVTDADIEKYLSDRDREGMTDVVRARAGHCDFPN